MPLRITCRYGPIDGIIYPDGHFAAVRKALAVAAVLYENKFNALK
ncbi:MULTISPECIES: hypothetical protein [unclassified Paenibacillus]